MLGRFALGLCTVDETAVGTGGFAPCQTRAAVVDPHPIESVKGHVFPCSTATARVPGLHQ